MNTDKTQIAHEAVDCCHNSNIRREDHIKLMAEIAQQVTKLEADKAKLTQEINYLQQQVNAACSQHITLSAELSTLHNRISGYETVGLVSGIAPIDLINEQHRQLTLLRENKVARIYTKCPACGNDTLTINDDKHLLCTWHTCPNPTLIDSLRENKAGQDYERVCGEVRKANRMLDRLSELFDRACEEVAMRSDYSATEIRKQYETVYDSDLRNRIAPTPEPPTAPEPTQEAFSIPRCERCGQGHNVGNPCYADNPKPTASGAEHPWRELLPKELKQPGDQFEEDDVPTGKEEWATAQNTGAQLQGLKYRTHRPLPTPAPEPTVPLSAEDVPPGSVLQRLGETCWLAILATGEDGVFFYSDKEESDFLYFTELKTDDWLINRNDGHGFVPASKQAQEKQS